MALIEFKDLPTTDTAIDADNLNHNFNELIAQYSTSEIKTNDTFNNKPVYRKCIINASAETLNTENVIDSISNIENVVSICGTGLLSSAYVLPLPYKDSLNEISLYLKKVGTYHNIIVVIGQTIITNINVIIEYTKTTN